MTIAEYCEDPFDDILPDGKMFRLTFDSNQKKFRILARNKEDLDDLIRIYTCDNPGAFFSRQYGYNTQLTVSVINTFGFFAIGLLSNVLSYIKTTYGTLNCIAISKPTLELINSLCTPLKDFVRSNNLTFDNFEVKNISNKISLRDYQTNIIKALITTGFGRGLFECPTGSGKSFIIANYIYNIQEYISRDLRILILVPNRQLVDQFNSDLLEYGFSESDVSRLAGGVKRKKNARLGNIIISNRQYMFNHVNELPKIDVLIVDEAHQVAPNSSTASLIDSFETPLKIGCSGTLPKEKYQRWNLIGMFNKILYTEDIVNLQKQGYISKLQIDLVRITDTVVERDRNFLFHTRPLHRYDANDPAAIAFNDAYNAEIAYINDHYADLYKPLLTYIEKFDGNILILFDRIEFGEHMFELAKDLNIRGSTFHYIDGSIDVESRENTRQTLENSNNNILFAQSSVFSTGINIKNLTNIVFFFSGKSYSKIIQSIGRTLRLHKDKKMARLIDVAYNFKYSQKHLKDRLQIYKDAYHKTKPDNIINLTI